MRVLRLGLSGPDVQKWKAFLKKMGFDSGSQNLDFDSGTEKASKAYQKANGLKADGIIGNKTFAKAMSQGFELLPDIHAAPGSAKVVKVKTVEDGVTIFKLVGSEAVFFTSDLDVDADGCPIAYGPNNTGLDHNGNAQNPVSSGNWNPNVVLLDSHNQPVRQKAGDPAPGFFICFSTLQDANANQDDPRRYVDALTIPYLVLPGGTAGPARTGDVGLVIDLQTGVRVKCIAADAGPKKKTGEASIRTVGILADGLTPKQIAAAAKKDKLKGLHCNPRNGGLNGAGDRHFRYIVFPGTTMTWPTTVEAIEARVDGALANLNPDQLLAITT